MIKFVVSLLLFIVFSVQFCISQNSTLKDSVVLIKGKEYLLHKIRKGETFSELAKQYHVNAKDIEEANPKLGKGLKAGKTLNIPNRLPSKVSSVKEIKSDTVVVKPIVQSKEIFNVGLLLPFIFPETIADDSSMNKPIFFDQHENANTLSSIEFYEGVILALDSLKKLGLHVNLHTFVAPDDSVEVKKLLLNTELKRLNLIIGPLFNRYIDKVSNYSKTNKIPMVYPFANQTLIEENPFATIISPTIQTQTKIMAKYVSDHYRFENVIIVHTKSTKEKELDSIYIEVIEKPWIGSGNKHTIKHYDISEKGIEVIKRGLDTAGENIIITNIQDEATVSEMVSKLNGFRADYDIALIGMPRWENYETIDIDYLQNLDYHWYTSTYINQDDSLIKHFNELFNAKYHFDPTLYAIRGFDIMNYYGNLFLRFNAKFENHVSEYKMKSISTNFDLKKNSSSSGMENQCIQVLKFDDFKVKKVNE
ncbi:MAG: LysM peptidoglycan-binding domain-containing protein [Bacteroidota bacterium]